MLTEAELKDALDGLFAYDNGSVDSGIHDEALRATVQKQLQEMRPLEHRRLIAKFVIDLYLSEKAIEAGYGPEDARGFLEWLGDEMGCLEAG